MEAWILLRQCCHGAPYYLEHPLLRGTQRFPLGRVHELVRKDVVQKLSVLAHTNPGKGREETVGKEKWSPKASPEFKLHVKRVEND